MPPNKNTKKDSKGQQQTLDTMMTTQKKPSASAVEHREP